MSAGTFSDRRLKTVLAGLVLASLIACGQRVAEMMQHAGASDDIELPPERAQLQYVALGIFDIREAGFRGLSFGVGKAIPA